MPPDEDREVHIRELEKRIAALEKTNAVLVRAAEQRTEAGESAYELFKSTSLLERRVSERTARLKEVEERLRRSLSLVRATLDSTADGILVVDLQRRIVDYNNKFVELWDVPAEIMEGKDADRLLDFVSTKISAPDDFIAKVDGLYVDFDSSNIDELRFKDGRIIERYSIPHRIEGRTIGRVWSFRDVTEHRRAIEQLRELANYDSLTGLPNRLHFNEQLGRTLSRALRQKTLVAVLFMDLDRFKSINDSLGHDAGDELLRSVAGRVKACLRDNDVLARLGGDEFTIALADIASPESAAKVANRIIEAFAQPFEVGSNTIYSSTSIGIAVYPGDALDVESLLKTADTAMYRAKELGRGTYQFYTRELTLKAQELLHMESCLRRAILKGEFLLHYQPQLDLKTNSLIGFEALIRWQHPEEGLLLPGRFIHLAEETGLIMAIGEWVLREACSQWRRWRDAGLPPVIMAVNLSKCQFKHKNLTQTVQSIIAETGMDPAYLELELTESTFMANIETTLVTLEKLKALGLRLAIDDFGTGYSSLGFLKRLPIDSLKIDRSFIRDTCADSEGGAIVEAILALAHALQLVVLAEGVETVEELSFLKDRNCNFAQGFYFSKAIPVEQAEEYLMRATTNS